MYSYPTFASYILPSLLPYAISYIPRSYIPPSTSHFPFLHSLPNLHHPTSLFSPFPLPPSPVLISPSSLSLPSYIHHSKKYINPLPSPPSIPKSLPFPLLGAGDGVGVGGRIEVGVVFQVILKSSYVPSRKFSSYLSSQYMTGQIPSYVISSCHLIL